MLLPDYESLVPVLMTFARELVTFVARLPNCTSFRELVPLFADIRVPQELIDSDSNPPHPSQEKRESNTQVIYDLRFGGLARAARIFSDHERMRNGLNEPGEILGGHVWAG